MTKAGAGTLRSRGRPRARSKRSGVDPQEELLDAAAQLFVEGGYTATTTRAIADHVGVKQGLLYYHFGSKEEILAELLRRIIAPPLETAAMLTGLDDVTPEVRLAALVACDSRELLTAEHNVGRLFLLPEVRQGQFPTFLQSRDRLRGFYLEMIEQSVGDDFALPLPTGTSDAGPPAAYLVDIVLGLVESTIAIREDRPAKDWDVIEALIMTSVLRVLGIDGDRLDAVVEEVRTRFPPKQVGQYRAARGRGVDDRKSTPRRAN